MTTIAQEAGYSGVAAIEATEAAKNAQKFWLSRSKYEKDRDTLIEQSP